MIKDIFASIPMGMGRSLFADVGALWKRERNVDHIFKKRVESYCFLGGYFDIQTNMERICLICSEKEKSNKYHEMSCRT